MAEEIRVPDIGDFSDVEIIEVLVAEGDSVEAEAPLITLESDKASMEVPSPKAGKIVALKVALGDRVSEGDVIALLEATDRHAAEASEQATTGDGDRQQAEERPQDPDRAAGQEEAERRPPQSEKARASGTAGAAQREAAAARPEEHAGAARPRAPSDDAVPPVRFDADRILPDKVPHASPAVRRFARELGVDLTRVEGSGRKGRIRREDVEAYVKGVMQGERAPPKDAAASTARGGSLDLLPWPAIDFGKFGATEEQPLSRIQKLSGANLARNWAMIPHVTQHDAADITEMEAFRKAHGEQAKAEGFKLTPLAFLIKAAVAALKKFPTFNASLAPGSETLVLKKYFHIGVAVDTPNGLVVPVIRECDRKSLFELAADVVAASERARDGKLSPSDMQGGCFTISSLGGIGGTAFTPIINAPEVAILGVSKASLQPVWDGSAFAPRLMLPLSVSYDHRVIDGATAARFTSYLAHVLGDIRRLLL